jgi:SAM-dependent methyltransferase
MEAKLASADIVSARWDALAELPQRPPPGAAPADPWAQREFPPGAGALSRPHVRAALRAAAQEGPILALDLSGGALARTLAPELLRPPALLRRLRSSGAPDVTIIASPGALDDAARQSVAGAITCAALVHTPDPAGLLARLWRLLRPGGWLLLAAETVQNPGLGAYLARLRALMDDQLSQNHDTLISPEAAGWIARARAEALADPEAPQRWAAAHCAAAGIDLDSAAAALGATVVVRRRYGGLWYHPAAPFPEVESPAGPWGDTWATELWRKPGG